MDDGSASGGKADDCLATRENRYVLHTSKAYLLPSGFRCSSDTLSEVSPLGDRSLDL